MRVCLNTGLTGLEMMPRVGPFEGGTLLTLYGYNFKNVSHTVCFYHIMSGTSRFQNASVINNSDQVTSADGCCTTCRECQSSLITTTLPAAGFLPDEYISGTSRAFHAITVQVFESDEPTNVFWGFLYDSKCPPAHYSSLKREHTSQVEYMCEFSPPLIQGCKVFRYTDGHTSRISFFLNRDAWERWLKCSAHLFVTKVEHNTVTTEDRENMTPSRTRYTGCILRAL
jgi:hypothetical protein